MQSMTFYRKGFIITLVVLAIVISVGFTTWYVNHTAVNNFHKLEVKVESLDQRVKRLSSENKKLKETVAKLYKYDQSIAKKVSKKDKSKIHQIGDSVGDLLKGFVF